MVAKGTTNLENRLRIRPAGVVSKNLMGLLKIAKAIRSCSFRDAYNERYAELGSQVLTIATTSRKR
jgi:hypothetical protein